jgi:hypothetical protein
MALTENPGVSSETIFPSSGWLLRPGTVIDPTQVAGRSLMGRSPHGEDVVARPDGIGEGD